MKSIIKLFKMSCFGCTVVLCCIFPLLALLSFIVCTIIYLLWNDKDGDIRIHEEL